MVAISGKNFECSEPTCAKLLVKFVVANDNQDQQGIVVPGKLESSSKITVEVPAYTKPDVLNIKISFNGVDYTSSDLTYGYFDPFVIKVMPELMPSEKASKITVKGFGFIQPDVADDIKCKFTSPKGDLKCDDKDTCTVVGTFVDKYTLNCPGKALNKLSYPDGKKVGVAEPVFVEVTLIGDHFTE